MSTLLTPIEVNIFFILEPNLPILYTKFHLNRLSNYGDTWLQAIAQIFIILVGYSLPMGMDLLLLPTPYIILYSYSIYALINTVTL